MRRHTPLHLTPHQASSQWAPTVDSVARLITRIKPKRYDGALCAGKAPLFDKEQLDGETAEQYQDRKEYMRQHCKVCQVTKCPSR